ncbi:MAG: thiamine-phosphate kinase, partial [Vicinamibacterales bacterium]|nr:thiamine-phosphate kinase [Vicinamibacterales bacterium]
MNTPSKLPQPGDPALPRHEPHRTPTVADAGERALIQMIRRRLPPAPGWVLTGVGDDAAVVQPARNTVDVLTTDALVEGVHFDCRFTPPAAIGHRAMAANLSDLASMGALPRVALLSLALPGAWPVADLEALMDGLISLASAHGVHLVGGNITRSPGPLVVDVTA